MTRLRSVILPQRHIAGQWTTVEPSRATAWLAVPLKGAPARFQTKRAAQEHNKRADRLVRPQRRFSPGARCPSRLPSRALLATSSQHKPEEY